MFKGANKSGGFFVAFFSFLFFLRCNNRFLVFLFVSLGMMLLKIMTLVAVKTQETALKYWFALI